MGWDIELLNAEGEIVDVPSHLEGGIIMIGGSTKASMSVTWNYSKYYYDYLDKENGFRWLNGKKAKDTIRRLLSTVTILGIETSDDYWEATEGNAGHILNVLSKWAKLHPEATWRVS